jgi:hypothetical protein
MTATYESIATTTVGTATNNVTFSSISSSFTDLLFILDLNNSSSALGSIQIQFNSDTGSNYSHTYLLGNGSSASSAINSNGTYSEIGYLGTTGKIQISTNIMNYSNTTTNKTLISRFDAAQSQTGTYVGLWRSTSAINSVKIITQNNMATGSTLTLYGIKAE